MAQTRRRRFERMKTPLIACDRPTAQVSRQPASLLRVIASAACLAIAGIADADTIRIEGFDIPNVRVENISNGVLLYSTASGAEVRQPIDRIQSMKLDDHPQLERALALEAENKHKEALEQLREIRTNVAWIKHWVAAQVVRTATAAGESEAAVVAYLDLVQTKADPFYIENVPVKALAAADDRTKARLVNRIQAAIDAQPARSVATPLLRQLLDVAKVDNQTLQEMATDKPPAVELPANMRLTDPVTKLLREGKFDEALAAVNEALKIPGGTDMKLYQRGIAQLNLAQAVEADQGLDAALKGYKDAGLSFMRAVIYFPRSPYVGPALIEAGYVHAKIGREDIAAKLYDEALPLIDEETNPGLAQRLDQFRKQLSAPRG